jgi:hypothetical protein
MKSFYMAIIMVATLFFGCKKEEQSKSTKGDIYVTVKSNSGYSSGSLLKGVGVFTVPPTKQGITDEFGTVLLKDIEAGTYEVFANLEGYGSGKSVLKVRADSLNLIDILIVRGVKTGFTPEIEMTLPTLPALFSPGDPVVFSLNVKDLDSAPASISVVISSNLDGKLVETQPDATNYIRFETAKLSGGVHQITITATDKDKYSSVMSFELSTLAPSKIEMNHISAKDGQVILGWKKYTSSDFLRYEVYRSNSDDQDGQLITSFGSADSIKYTDRTPPIVSEIYYYVKIVNLSNYSRISNYLKVDYPAGKFYYYSPTDALHHPSAPVLFIVDNSDNMLRSINYITGEEKNGPVLMGNIGKIDIGDNGFGLEIYAPSSDGHIYIYDATDLNLKSSITTGLSTASVVTNGHGYLVASLRPSPWWEMPVRTYSRSTGLNISGNTGTVFEGSILRYIPNTDNLILISTGVSPTDMDYFEMDSSGNIINQKDDPYHGDHDLDPFIFRISPNGLFLVTGQKGTVYSAASSLLYKGEIPRGALTFSDYAFSEDGNTIYGATSNRSSIQVIKYPQLTRNDEYLLKGFPKYIFRYNNEIIALSLINTNTGNFIIESVNIK